MCRDGDLDGLFIGTKRATGTGVDLMSHRRQEDIACDVPEACGSNHVWRVWASAILRCRNRGCGNLDEVGHIVKVDVLLTLLDDHGIILFYLWQAHTAPCNNSRQLHWIHEA